MKHETSRALYAYWLSCHRDSGVRAAGVNAVELAPILPSLFLIDLNISAGPPLRFRYCGASLSTRYGRDLTDESFLALWSPEDAASLKRDLKTAEFRFTGLVAGMMTETMGGGFIAHEMLLLPLAGETGTAGAIGSIARIAGNDDSNRLRARAVSQTLRSIRFLPEAAPRGTAFVSSRPPALAATAARQRKRYGHLTVVSGGK